MAILYVRDSETRKILEIVEDFTSLVWTERYQEAGEFVLNVPTTIENIRLFQRGRYLSFDESDETMVINTINITESYGDEEEPSLEITGKSLASLLERRVNASQIVNYHKGGIAYSGSFSSVVSSIFSDEISNPKQSTWVWFHEDADGSWSEGFDGSQPVEKHVIRSVFKDASDRKIDNFVFSNKISSGQDVEINDVYTEIMDVYSLIVSLCRKHLMGFKVVLNSSNEFELQVYSGTDRTTNQKTLSPVIFNPIMDNISYVNYFEDDTDFKNYIFPYTNGYITFAYKNDITATVEIFPGYSWDHVGESATGINRREIAFDGSSEVDSTEDYEIDKEYTVDGETIEITAWQVLLYTLEKKLRLYGREQYEDGEYEIVTTSEGSIDPLVRYKYGVDYFMGDRVDITNANGIVMTGIIDEVVKSYDTDGVLITPNFKNMTEYDWGEEETE